MVVDHNHPCSLFRLLSVAPPGSGIPQKKDRFSLLMHLSMSSPRGGGGQA